MDRALIKTILNHEFYAENKVKLRSSIFSQDEAALYEIVALAHDQYDHDLTPTDINTIWMLENPLATRTMREDFSSLVDDLASHDGLSDSVAKTAIETLWQREVGRDVANLGIAMAEGNLDAMQSLQSLLERVAEGYMPDDFGDPTTDDIHQLLAEASDDARWKFNIQSLSDHVYGIGPSEFGVVFALPETGKSAFVVSLIAGPGGWCEQGAKVLFLGNEEATRRTKLRAMSSWAGMSIDDMTATPELANTRYLAIRDRLIMKDSQEWDMSKLDAYCRKIKPDVLVIDQLDKVMLAGKHDSGHERLREVYRQARELAKRHECALIGVSQASDAARNRTRLDFSMMEGSKIGKAAEADLIIGIGKSSGEEDDGPDNTRYLNVSKNKISGWHGMVNCQLLPEVSRYVK